MVRNIPKLAEGVREVEEGGLPAVQRLLGGQLEGPPKVVNRAGESKKTGYGG
jgi:hypothetical protein